MGSARPQSGTVHDASSLPGPSRAKLQEFVNTRNQLPLVGEAGHIAGFMPTHGTGTVDFTLVQFSIMSVVPVIVLAFDDALFAVDVSPTLVAAVCL